ncbi:MAG: threonine synthase [Deltaproteobacteria bacterium]|nr:threonine synthase [Deltaproteobacteria bacterium]
MSGIIRKYHSFLPINDRFIVTLLEGNTPLLPAPRLAAKIFGSLLKNPPELYLKLEGLNPTGSFKDRGMTYAVSKALEAGSQAVICASTGNTSASAAAYAARAGIRAYVVIPKGKIALGKLSQAVMHGARVVAVEGNFDEALRLVKEIAQEGGVTLVNSINPHRLEGQKTAAFEICEQLGGPPTHHLLPVGNAGNITAHWKGYREFCQTSPTSPTGRTILPKMLGFQAAGAAPIVLGHVVKEPRTVATAIRIGNPASWQGAVAARDESSGVIDKVTDREILEAYKMIATLEGYFCEPASAASVAGLNKLARQRYFGEGDRIVCTLTGHGLKDPDNAIRISRSPVTIKPELKKLIKALKL